MQPGDSHTNVSDSRACSLNLEVSCLRQAAAQPFPGLPVAFPDRWLCTRDGQNDRCWLWPVTWKRERVERYVLDPEEKAQVWVLAPAMAWAGMWTRPSYGQSVLWGSNAMNGCESAPHTLKQFMKKQRDLLIVITVVIFGLGAKNWTLDIPLMTWQRHLQRWQEGSAVLWEDSWDYRHRFPILALPVTSTFMVSASSSVKRKKNYCGTEGDGDYKMLSTVTGTA